MVYAFPAEDFDSAFFNAFLCPVCAIEFCVETGDPRTLKCGHILCSRCLMNIEQPAYRKYIECPVCRGHSKIKLRNEVPVHESLKAALHKYKLIKKKKQAGNGDLKNLLALSSDKEKSPYGQCSKHPSNPIHFGCITCKVWFCGECACDQHLQENCSIYPIVESILRMKMKIEKEAQSDRLKVKNRINDLNALLKITTRIPEQHKNQLQYVLKESKTKIETRHSRYPKLFEYFDELLLKLNFLQNELNKDLSLEDFLINMDRLKATQEDCSYVVKINPTRRKVQRILNNILRVRTNSKL